MTFLNPLGFLALIAVPILILIYIIKSKYTEQTVTSTYLWTLSERFLKRRNPIRKITGIISLILQILAVLFIALAVAHPVFTLPGKAQDYCFILDGSGSMQVEQGGTTRFNVGKGRISDMISSAADGSTFTLITTGDTTDMVMKEVSDKKSAIRQLNAVQPSYAASDLSGAVSAAQNYFEGNKACKFYVFSDKTIEESSDNVEVFRIGEESFNCALDGVDYSLTADGAVVTGKVFAYVNSAEATVGVYVNDGTTAAATADVSVEAGEGVDFSLTVNSTTFTSLRVCVTAQGDRLKLDDEVVLYNSHAEATYKTLIVSETPDFIRFALQALGHTNVDIVDNPTGNTEGAAADAVGPYTDEMRGYGLYIFQNFVPDIMPEDGAVWFINPPASVESSGFTYSDRLTFENPVILGFNKNTSTRVRSLLKNTKQEEEIYINEYVKLGAYRSFTTLMSCGGDPVILAGSNAYGNREVVFAFDFVETSDFVMSYSGGMILRNLVGYTFPDLVDETLFYCGQTLMVNVLANCREIRVERPSGRAEYLDTADAISEYELTEVGEYTVTAIIGNNRQSVKVFAQLPVGERTVTSADTVAFKIVGEPSAHKRDGKYEDLLYAFIILAVIVVADWAVYCYEQYQLR